MRAFDARGPVVFALAPKAEIEKRSKSIRRRRRDFEEMGGRRKMNRSELAHR